MLWNNGEYCTAELLNLWFLPFELDTVRFLFRAVFVILNFIVAHCWQGCLSAVPWLFGLANAFFLFPIEVGSGFLPNSWS